MDAVQFGRWLAERRHLCGWPSQRALVEAAHAHPMRAGADISEAFLARLEAGHLAHPFRGSVRQRVLFLAWLLCRTVRDTRIYMRVSGLTELTADESRLIERLRQRLDGQRAPVLQVLPARSHHFVGRGTELALVMEELTARSGGVVGVTGLPGVGKSALAREAAQRFADNGGDAVGTGEFADGIIYQDLARARGLGGLVMLLDQIAAYVDPPRDERLASVAQGSAEDGDLPEVERAIARARRVLGSRDVLIVLDNVDPKFPLRDAVVALLAREGGATHEVSARERLAARRAILFTSRYVPAPALMSRHIRLAPLPADEAIDLFATLARHPLTDDERDHAALICAALGNLPLAIEVAATAAAARGIPLDLLAAHASDQPLGTLLDGEGDLRRVFAQALAALAAPVRERFALLGALGARTFGIEWAASVHPVSGTPVRSAAVRARALPSPSGGPVSARAPGLLEDADDAEPDSSGVSRASVARAASELGELVRHSLLTMLPGYAVPATPTHPRGAEDEGARAVPTRYQIHPLVAAYAHEYLEEDYAANAEEAQRDAQAYALAYVEQHAGDLRALESEREMVLAMLTQAWHRREDAVVVRLINGLWRLIGRFGNFELSARILYWGIAASQRLDDQYQQARFLNRLGTLLHYHGEPLQARRAWEASLALAETLRQPAEIWHPLANLALMACEAGDFDRARRLAAAYLRRGQEAGELAGVAHALFNRGLGAHLRGDDERAFADLTACTRLLALRGASDHAAHEGILQLAAQAELARVQGDFARARHHSEMAIALAQEAGDHYTVADLLLDQARFAHAHHQQDEARTLATRVVEVAARIGAHQLHREGLILLQQ